jgi:lysophospholipase L1-like esterase
MRVRGVVPRLALASISTLLALLVGEIGLRLHARATDPARVDASEALEASRRASLPTDAETAGLLGLVRPSANRSVIFELKPELDGSFLGRPVRTNSRGMRGPDVEVRKPPGTLRIVGLGDSVMFGWGVAEGESYMGLLAEALDGGDPPVEVLNFAVPGYNTAMQVATFRSKVLTFEPDLVLLHVVNNDFDLPRFLLEPHDVWATDRSFLLDRIRGVSRGSEGRWLQPTDFQRLDDEDRQRVRTRYRHLVGVDAFRNAVARLARRCGERDIPVLVIVTSCAGEMWSVVCAAATEHDFTILDMGERLSRYLVENGLENTRQGWIDTFWLSPDDPHPNALAHSIHAEAVLDELQEMGFVPATTNRTSKPGEP